MNDDELGPPPGLNWTMYQRSEGLEHLVGPFYVVREGLEEGEPLRLGFRVAARHANSRATCHGGMLATFMDQALGMSVNAATGAHGPTMSLTIDYLSAAMVGDWIESRTRLVHETYRTGYIDGLAIGPNGPIARASGLWRLTRPKPAAD